MIEQMAAIALGRPGDLRELALDVDVILTHHPRVSAATVEQALHALRRLAEELHDARAEVARLDGELFSVVRDRRAAMDHADRQERRAEYAEREARHLAQRLEDAELELEALRKGGRP